MIYVENLFCFVNLHFGSGIYISFGVAIITKICSINLSNITNVLLHLTDVHEFVLLTCLWIVWYLCYITKWYQHKNKYISAKCRFSRLHLKSGGYQRTLNVSNRETLMLYLTCFPCSLNNYKMSLSFQLFVICTII